MMVLLLGCVAPDAGPVPAPENDDTGPIGAPALDLNPRAYAFDDTPVGSSRGAAFVVSNTGDADLELGSVTLEDPSTPFLVSPLDQVSLAPGESTSFGIQFAPVAEGDFESRVGIVSNDPAQPTAWVTVGGLGWLAPDLSVDPLVYEFGQATGTAEETLTLSNVGLADLTVSELRYTSASDELTLDVREETNGPLPWVVAAGGALEITVRYTPVDDSPDEGLLTIVSDDPVTPETLAWQYGDGVAP